MTDVNDCPEFFELLEALVAETITDEQRTELEGYLRRDPKFQRAYFQYLHMHVCLRRALGGAGAAEKLQSRTPVLTVAPPVLKPVNRIQRFFFLASGLAAALLAIALFVHHAQPPAQLPHSSTEIIATLTNAQGCVWDSKQELQRGSKLQPGRLVLTAGVAQLTFSSGAVALLEAPADLELIGSSRAYLHAGRVVVRAEDKSQGFVVDTARAEVLDLGTEFGVGVSPSGETLVQVFDGVVEAELKSNVTTLGKKRLNAGEAMEFDDGASRSLIYSAERFIRRLPDPPPEKFISEQWLVPYNKNRVDSIQVTRVPGKITIDGNLADWDRSFPFKSRCAEPYGEHYNVEGYMMADDQYLYIGAHVRDPSPMRSVIDPLTDPNVGWKGGSVQVRIATDRSMAWPSQAEGYTRKGPRRPIDISSNLCHITMWYFRPDKLPCLHLEYGMNFHGMQINPDGYQGAYTKDADGRGYTMEYAVPWSLLHAEKDPPRAGDTVAACWNVHWSDDGGRLW
ncbi:MAG TPA: FecR domain-containing protein, partial [Planctomycetota bacterium]|nr:FecR domain-containing protein [Planctomycetota bacterium]